MGQKRKVFSQWLTITVPCTFTKNWPCLLTFKLHGWLTNIFVLHLDPFANLFFSLTTTDYTIIIGGEKHAFIVVATTILKNFFFLKCRSLEEKQEEGMWMALGCSRNKGSAKTTFLTDSLSAFGIYSDIVRLLRLYLGQSCHLPSTLRSVRT